MASDEQVLDINGVRICTQTFGSPDDPAVLLVHGACASMLWWEEELCERIAAAGRFVIRYDNRDTGRSTWYPPGRPGYSITDFATDAVGVLDAYGIARAHLVCRSMSGAVGLIAGVDHPDRVASLTFVATTTGDLPPGDAEMPPEPDITDDRAVVDHIVAVLKAYAGDSPHFDEAATRARAERDVARTANLASALTNHFAMDFDGPVNGGYADIQAPALVVHGDLDPIYPVGHGVALRDAIPGARLLTLKDTGHDLPEPTWDVFVPEFIRHTAGGDR